MVKQFIKMPAESGEMETMRKKIQFVTYGAGHANIVKALAPTLSNYYEVQILALTVAFKVFDSENIPYKKLNDYMYLFSDVKEEVLAYGDELAKETFNPKSGMSYEESQIYLGLSFWNLVKTSDSKAEAKRVFRENGRKVFNPVYVMKRILKEEKPDLLVVTCDVRMERAAGIAANELGIPVLRIHDLIEIYTMSYKACVCVMNEYVKNYLIRNRLCESKDVKVTGQPVFEKNIEINEKYVKEMNKEFGFDGYQKIFLYLEAPQDPDSDIIENEFKRMSENHLENLYIIKLHPNQDFVKEEQKSENYKKIRDIELKYLIHAADVVITRDSTGGIEAALMGKPLVIISLSRPFVLDYSKYGVAVKAGNVEEMERLMAECCDKESEIYKEIQKGQKLFQNKPHAVENILNKIREIFEER